MRWLTNFYDFRFKWTATAAIEMHPTKAWLSQLVNFKNAIWTLEVIAVCFVLSYFVHAPCFLWPTAAAICVTSSRWWISSETILFFFLLIVDSLGHQCYGWRPRSALPFATVPIISFILRPILHSLQLFWPSISKRLLWKAGRCSLVGHKSHAAPGKVALYLI